MAVSIEDGCERLERIAQRLRFQLDAGRTPRVRRKTARGFLKWFGYSRRGNYIVEQIRQCLEEHQLRTVPDFEGAWINGTLTFELNLRDDKGRTQEPNLPDPTIRLDSISSAHTPPEFLAPEDTVIRALSKMQMDGISHVIVSGDGRSPMGVVSWKSIVDLLAGSDGSLDSEIRDCIEPAGAQMSLNDPLFEATALVLSRGYVLVKGEAGAIGGIVTAANLAEKYEALALPFQMIGEIEGYLRRRIHSKLSQEQIDKALAHADHSNRVGGNNGLTFADYMSLVGNTETWNNLGLVRVDSKVLNEHLEWLRGIRNDIMHFTIDELRPSELTKLKSLVNFFRRQLK